MIQSWTNGDLERLREAGRINGCAHEMVRERLAAGITAREVDQCVGKFLEQQGCQSSFRSMMFPGNTCISINDAAGHGVPDDTVICDGDVVKVDIGVEFEGFHSDAAATHIVGRGTPGAAELVHTARRALHAGIRAAQPWRRASDVSYALEQTVLSGGFQVVKNAFGHGVGRRLHEEPQIAAFGPPSVGPRLRPGMVIAIEPVVVSGRPNTYVCADGWTTRTCDGGLAAHFEHTILVTEAGPEILTRPGKTDPRHSPPTSDWILPGQDYPLEVREKCASDDDELLNLAQSQMNPILAEAWGRPVFPQEVLEPKSGLTMVIRHPSGRLMAFFTTCQRGTALHLVTLVVHPDWQGVGLGRYVMQRIEKHARERGDKMVTLWVQTNNVRARGFYESLGYTECGTPFFNTVAMHKPALSKTGSGDDPAVLH